MTHSLDLTYPFSEVHTHSRAANQKQLQLLFVPPQVPRSFLRTHTNM